jgi:hypothetical protein
VTTSYTSTAKALHWLMAILFFGLLALGFYMHDLPLSPEKAAALLLAQMGRRQRLPARLVPPVLARHASPARAAGQHAEADAVGRARRSLPALRADARHSALRLADEFGQGFPDGLVRRPADPRSAGKNKELGDLLQTVHMSLNLLFVAVIAGHIGAALKHHFIDKDDILTRMLPAHNPRRNDMKRHRPRLSSSLATFRAHAVEYTQVQPTKAPSTSPTSRWVSRSTANSSDFPASSVSTRPSRPPPRRAFDVELASVDTGAPEGDDEVAGKPWFNTKAFPTAKFVSGGVKALGGNAMKSPAS